jgi:hypothetical protein
MDDEIEASGHFDVIDGGKGSALGGDKGPVDHAADGPGYVLGLEWATVVESNTIAQMDV